MTLGVATFFPKESYLKAVKVSASENVKLTCLMPKAVKGINILGRKGTEVTTFQLPTPEHVWTQEVVFQSTHFGLHINDLHWKLLRTKNVKIVANQLTFETFPMRISNVYPDGKVCWGKLAPVPNTIPQAIGRFWSAPFNFDLLEFYLGHKHCHNRTHVAVAHGKTHPPGCKRQVSHNCACNTPTHLVGCPCFTFCRCLCSCPCCRNTCACRCYCACCLNICGCPCLCNIAIDAFQEFQRNLAPDPQNISSLYCLKKTFSSSTQEDFCEEAEGMFFSCHPELVFKYPLYCQRLAIGHLFFGWMKRISDDSWAVYRRPGREIEILFIVDQSDFKMLGY